MLEPTDGPYLHQVLVAGTAITLERVNMNTCTWIKVFPINLV